MTRRTITLPVQLRWCDEDGAQIEALPLADAVARAGAKGALLKEQVMEARAALVRWRAAALVRTQ